MATDVAARGLDISKIQSVIHYDVARSPQVFTVVIVAFSLPLETFEYYLGAYSSSMLLHSMRDKPNSHIFTFLGVRASIRSYRACEPDRYGRLSGESRGHRSSQGDLHLPGLQSTALVARGPVLPAHAASTRHARQAGTYTFFFFFFFFFFASLGLYVECAEAVFPSFCLPVLSHPLITFRSQRYDCSDFRAELHRLAGEQGQALAHPELQRCRFGDRRVHAGRAGWR